MFCHLLFHIWYNNFVPKDRLTLTDAAQRLGVSRRRAEAMVLKGQLPAERLGNQWAISAASVRAVDHNMWREPGRPLAQGSAWELYNQGRALAGQRQGTDLDRVRRRLRSRAR